MKLVIGYKHPGNTLHCVNNRREWERNYEIKDGLVEITQTYCPFCMNEVPVAYRRVEDS